MCCFSVVDVVDKSFIEPVQCSKLVNQLSNAIRVFVISTVLRKRIFCRVPVDQIEMAEKQEHLPEYSCIAAGDDKRRHEKAEQKQKYDVTFVRSIL